ncbi:TetR family transcriptional regulator [Geodermatophilus sp. TF02-6]|uniref:TetR/AcrR family transcriptional regulator n=1 Tax=Geodermatophilus sp. TF02-6 TaxID=2250575 RepID=UPI000DEA14C3|nr:TetR/AcrR family transcriptional regulator [Geodermatophilus sp. TF02-6]RBY76837.1 TetR family transcriptional regulator [Geodermatophilus sp. TF02-6]
MARPSVEAERREQILSAACEVVSEIGFKSLRVADVAKRAGTSTGTVHYYFDTKTELMRAAFEWNFARSLDRRRPLLDEHPDPRERLRAFVESYLPVDDVTVRAWHVWAELWVEALHDPDLQEMNEQVYGEWRRIVAGILRDGQDSGLFREEDPVLAANALIGMIDGLALQVLLRSRSMTVDRMRAVCDRTLRNLDVATV